MPSLETRVSATLFTTTFIYASLAIISLISFVIAIRAGDVIGTILTFLGILGGASLCRTTWKEYKEFSAINWIDGDEEQENSK